MSGAKELQKRMAYKNAIRDRAHSQSGPLNPAGGRPCKLDDEEVWQLIMACASRRLSDGDVARAIRVHPSTFRNWLRMGEQELMEEVDPSESRWVRFYLEYNAARAQGAFYGLGVLMEAKDPRIVADWLKRTDTDMDYVDRDRVVSRPEININTLNQGSGVPAVDFGRSVRLGQGAAKDALEQRGTAQLQEGRDDAGANV